MRHTCSKAEGCCCDPGGLDPSFRAASAWRASESVDSRQHGRVQQTAAGAAQRLRAACSMRFEYYCAYAHSTGEQRVHCLRYASVRSCVAHRRTRSASRARRARARAADGSRPPARGLLLAALCDSVVQFV